MTEFIYGAEPLQTGTIRLLTLVAGEFADDIVCELHEHSIEAIPMYEALSYAWGHPHFTNPIQLESHKWLVTPNLDIALRHLRLLRSNRVLWIDALCINQASMLERNFQVAQMDQIYSSASKVLVWLEEESDDNVCAIRAMQLIDKDPSLHWNGKHENPTIEDHLGTTSSKGNFMRGLHTLSTNTWWSRVWTLQEAVLAKSLVFMVGQCSFGLDEFQGAAKSYANHCFDTGQGCCAGHRGYPVDSDSTMAKAIYLDWQRSSWMGMKIHEENEIMIERLDPSSTLRQELQSTEFQQWQYKRETWYSFIMLLHNVRLRECSNPQDRIYGSLGLSPVRVADKMKPDYALEVTVVFKNFQVWAMNASQCCDILRLLSPWTIHEEVTWLVNWERCNGRETDQLTTSSNVAGDNLALAVRLLPHTEAFCASKDTRFGKIEIVNSRGLLVPGFNFDRIKRVGSTKTDTTRWTEYDDWLTLACSDHDPLEPYLGSEKSRVYAFFESILAYDITGHIEQKIQTLVDNVELRSGQVWGLNTEQSVEDGDLICILYGSRVPFVIRDVSDTIPFDEAFGQRPYYKVVGDAHVNGIMYGEAMDLMEEQGLVEQDFLLL